MYLVSIYKDIFDLRASNNAKQVLEFNSRETLIPFIKTLEYLGTFFKIKFIAGSQRGESELKPPFKDKTTRDLAQWGGGPKTAKSKAIRANRKAAMTKPPFKGKNKTGKNYG